MISVITPSYRQLDWLRLCAASVADQAGVEVEQIVQDGGTDGISLDALSPTASNQQFDLRLHVEKDTGMYDAINRGLLRARGDICAYLNCDEQYLPGALARVSAFFASHPEIDLLFGDVVLIDESGNPLSYRRTILPSANHIRFAHLNTASCAMFFRRRLVERGLLFDPQWKAIGDAVWVQALLKDQVQMRVLAEPLAVFTFTGQNLGESALSTDELKKLRGTSRFPAAQNAAAVVLHRIRKMLAGAYRRRSIEIEVYTLTSPRARQHRSAERVGFGWPRRHLQLNER